MKIAYDRNRAKKLVPLLEVITRELADRYHEVRILQGGLSKLQADPQDDQGYTATLLDLRARLATHRREINCALNEIEGLGCVLDEGEPLLILIPGSDGNLSHGFRFNPNDPTLRRVSTGTAVP